MPKQNNKLGKNSRPRVYFRADSSFDIGIGHIMRCLALSERLAQKGCEVGFICRDLAGNISDVIREQGFSVLMLGAGAGFDQKSDARGVSRLLNRSAIVPEMLVIDHYAITCEWEGMLRPFVKKIMVIDDLADKKHDCDILLNQDGLDPSLLERYLPLLPLGAEVIIGPVFALLRSEFSEMRPFAADRSGELRKVLVFFGGIDISNETLKAVKALARAKFSAVKVVVGKTNPNIEKLHRYLAGKPGFELEIMPGDMASKMRWADLAIGGGGVSLWERCCMGLPSIVTIVADNQKYISEALGNSGIIVDLGVKETVTQKDYLTAFNSLSAERLRSMSLKSMALVDGLGAERVAESMMMAMC